MIIAFENYKASSSAIVGQVIRKVQGHDYVHVELIFEQHGWATLSARRKEDGVYIKPYQDVYTHPELWVGYRLPIQYEADLYQRAMQEVGKEFNYRGIFDSQVLRKATSHPDNRFCSEVVYALLKSAAIPFPDVPPNTVTPKILHQWVQQLQYPTVQLPANSL